MTTAELLPSTDAIANTDNFISSLDYYKLTMSQFFYDHEPEAEATFTFHNRGSQRLADNIRPEELQEAFDAQRASAFTATELAYLGSLTMADSSPVLSEGYLDYLHQSQLPPVEVGYDTDSRDLTISTTGPWPLATFWETAVMRTVSSAYGRKDSAIYDEGNRRLTEKIAAIKADPTLKIIEFGTRRAYSPDWHKHVLGRLATECPANLLGTSNIGFAPLTGLQPKGTFAHEAPMGYAALADARGEDVRASHGRFLDEWLDYYGPEYSIALSDTFTSDFFFRDFGPERAEAWRGIRQDSGNPAMVGRNLLRLYQRFGVDPLDRVCLFSDSLDIPKVQALHEEFGPQIQDIYGIGTKLTNDVGQPALNIVMKATHFRDPSTGQEADSVKLSDDPGKHTGPLDLVRQYQTIFT